MIRTKDMALVIVFVLGSSLLVANLRNQYEIPERWDSVHLGMTRSEVYTVVANPSGNLESNNVFWYRSTVAGWQELHVFFDKNDRASDLSVIRFLGTRNHFMKQTLRYEYDLIPTEIKHHDLRM